ncbi:MAG: hydrogenase expression/formation protein HypE [Planctomycetia bacterium]|nr:hydrogenase expression/formation protein HypE [Planctomycetia bacterium]
MPDFANLNCPVPRTETDRVLLGHGSGGRLSAELLRRVFLPALGNEILSALEDQATVDLRLLISDFRLEDGRNGSHLDPDFKSEITNLQSSIPRLAFTTDSFVVRPLFFPGGDIGKLAVNGTVNDLAVGGACPLFLSAAFILAEGFSFAELQHVVESMRAACAEVGVKIVTGDTKVVDRGACDGLFISTAGIGLVRDDVNLSIRNARPGDRVLVSGTIGDHGIAVMSVREGLEFETVLESDTAPLAGLTRAMLDACPFIRCMRDPTRGGVASALNELATASKVGVKLTESAIPLRSEVRAACEMLGLDPLYVACEGRLVAIVPPEHTERVLEVMRAHPLGRSAASIGEVVSDHPGTVTIRTPIGGERAVPLLAGAQLPRIC